MFRGANNSRSHRLVSLAQESQKTKENQSTEHVEHNHCIFLPSYESTKLSTSFERELAIRGWRQLELEEENRRMIKELQSVVSHQVNFLPNIDITQGNEIIKTDLLSRAGEIPEIETLLKSNDIELYENNEVLTSDQKKIKDINRNSTSDQVLKDKNTVLPLKNKEVGGIIKNLRSSHQKMEADENEFLNNLDYDTFSEDKTSGSEFLPTDDEDLTSYNSSNSNSFEDGVDSIYNEIQYKQKLKFRAKQTKKTKYKTSKQIKNRVCENNTDILSSKSTFRCDSDLLKINVCSSSHLEEDQSTYENVKSGKRNTTKIKILNNIVVKPPLQTEKINNFNPVVAIANADSTTIDHDVTPIANIVNICPARKTQDGKRIRDKKHSCYYCQELILHMARHMEVKHANEIEVAKALSFPKNSETRKNLLIEIIRVGDFHYNCEILSIKEGNLILVRRPTLEESKSNTYKNYGPCPNCLGFMLKKHLWHHLKTKCSTKNYILHTEEPQHASRHIIAESNAIVSNVFGTEFSNDYKRVILNSLRDDDVGECCKEDQLILRFGAMQFEKYGTTQAELIRQSMRQIARLTMTIKELTPQNLKLRDLLTPQKFDLIVQGVKVLCGRQQKDSTKRPEFETPSLALKLGHSLKKCANIERGLALRQENLQRNESLQAFCNLMQMEWQIRVSSNALSTLYKRKINAGQLLPVTSDLLKANEFIKKGLERAQNDLLELSTPENWSRLAKFTQTRIILFNKRRAGEASKMTIEQYSTRPSWTEQTNQELKAALTLYEIKLAERHTIVNIIGKRGKMVPVLLTTETKIAIDVLISHRSESVGINLKNPYVFARGSQALTSMRGPDVLKQIINSIPNLEKPELITSTRLRKYIATVCQIFDLSDNEYDWLARHLGHDIRVHRQFYRLHEDVVELTKVSRLLMAVDAGETHKFAGKKLDDIELKDLPPIEEEEDDNEENDFQENTAKVDVHEEQIVKDLSDVETEILSKLKKRNVIKKGTKKPSTRSPWDLLDKKTVFEYFRIQIKKGIVPGKNECETCQKENPSLKKRKWTDIKFCVKNQIDKIKKMK